MKNSLGAEKHKLALTRGGVGAWWRLESQRGAYTGRRRGIGTAVIEEEGGTHRHREGESPRRFAGCSLQWLDPTTTLHYNIDRAANTCNT